MTRLLIYLFVFSATLYFLSWWGRRSGGWGFKKEDSAPSRGFRSKADPREIWIQVYETDSLDEGRGLQARLQEEEVECILYEQGKKDIHGNPLKGIGVAVPKTAIHRAQTIINRMPA